ncbi:MAG: hypothetical protein PHH93_08750, partial [Prolixibacteraceae bacterium]|nr:hypothetical protein [Prolixibacteraceae bacterium]
NILGLCFIVMQIVSVNHLWGGQPVKWQFFQPTRTEGDDYISGTGKSGNDVLRLSTFDVDVTPPAGYEMAFGAVNKKWDLGLRAKGVVLSGAGLPIVLCAFDWHSIANESQDAFRSAFAEAAGTVPERVVVHTLHQHDAPICDFGAEEMLKNAGFDPEIFNGDFAREVIDNISTAIKKSIESSQPVTHIGTGEAEVYEVASNRRILGDDGSVRASRSSSSRSAELRAEPEGVIDPVVSLVSFWNGDEPLAVMSFYATHPQSYYRTGIPNPDFPGIARFYRQLSVPDALHVHFNGAAGNVAAGKYNDGSHENRLLLAQKLAEGMEKAWNLTKLYALSADQVNWDKESVALPPADHLIKLEKETTAEKSLLTKNRNAQKLAWYNRCKEGRKIDIQCLTLGDAKILFMPGELFVEYQLAAKKMRPDLFVAMAAYGDFGPHYIGTKIAYSQGGYEVSASDVSSEVEKILMSAVRKLLESDN